MSLSGHLLHRAAENAACAAARRLNIDERMAARLAPIAVALVLAGFRRNTAGLLGAAAFAFALNRHQEDLLNKEGRLGDADVRIRGEAILDKALGRHARRGAIVIADLAGLDLARATALLAMTAAGVIAALAKARRDLQLSQAQLRGVIKSESARVDGADPGLMADILDWVFQPPFIIRTLGSAGEILKRGFQPIRTAA